MPQSKKVPFWRSLQTKFAMTYILIVAAVLILLNTYPVMVSQDLAYRSKETSMQNQAAGLAQVVSVFKLEPGHEEAGLEPQSA